MIYTRCSMCRVFSFKVLNFVQDFVQQVDFYSTMCVKCNVFTGINVTFYI